MADITVIVDSDELNRTLGTIIRQLRGRHQTKITHAAAEAFRAWLIDRPGYISGNRVRVQGGLFRSSWTVRTSRTEQGAESRLGTPSKYARILEFGFRGTMQIPSYTRRKPVYKRQGESYRSLRSRKNRPGRPTEEVRAHSRTYPGRTPPHTRGFAPRRYLRDTLLFGQGSAVRAANQAFKRLINADPI